MPRRVSGSDASNGASARGALLSPWSPSEPQPSSPSRPRSGTSGATGTSRQSGSLYKTHSISSKANTAPSVADSVAATNRDKQRVVRVLPPWVHSPDEDEDDLDPTKRLLPKSPSLARPAAHHYMPTANQNAVRGRQFDHERQRTPVTISAPLSEQSTKWRRFVQSSAYGRPSSDRGEVVDDSWLKENMPDLEQPWEGDADAARNQKNSRFWLFSPTKRKEQRLNFTRTVLRNPIVPLVIRLTVLTFSTLALGLGGWLHLASAENQECVDRSSTLLAIGFDAVAIVYILYITWDEYTSKPLGLRSPQAKLRLIFCDLIFIAFDSANLSLAMESLTDQRQRCSVPFSERNVGPSTGPSDPEVYSCPRSICMRQETLAGVLFIALVAWLLTFSISTLRIVERVSRQGD